MIRVNIKITGKVQGVFFRKHAEEKANELSILGWVANDADGSVRVVLEGPENKINEFIDWCHSGPSKSEVEKVFVEYEDYSGEFEDFVIRY